MDQIIIVTLRDVGLDIDAQEITSISQFNDSLVVQSVARCLNIINSNNKLPEKLPDGMARRYRVGIELANACKELGLVRYVKVECIVLHTCRLFVFKYQLFKHYLNCEC